MKNIIYVVSHKPFTKPKSPLYQKIYVGKNRPKEANDYNDNTGNNIAKKNPNFCELTAIYWILKNDRTSKNIGISHYRRYFAGSFLDYLQKKYLDEKELEKYFEKYDLIAPLPMRIKNGNVLSQFCEEHHKKDLLECRKIITEKYPDYLDSFDETLKRKQYSQFNMLVAPRDLFEEYHNWLFDILFEAEKRIDLKDYDDYNKRLFGFLSERLFNVWLLKKTNLKIKYLPVISIEEDIPAYRKLLRLIRFFLMKNR